MAMARELCILRSPQVLKTEREKIILSKSTIQILLTPEVQMHLPFLMIC